MKAKFVQRGEIVDYIPASNVAAGDVVVLGDGLLGIAKLDIEAGKLGALALDGIYDVAKGSGAIAQWAILYWDATNSVVTTTATAIVFGVAVLAAESDDTSVRALLRSGAGTADTADPAE